MRKLIGTALVASVLAMSPGIGSAGAGSVQLQTATATDTAVQLAAGEPFTAPGYAVTVGAARVSRSVDRYGYDRVVVDVAFRNLGDAPVVVGDLDRGRFPDGTRLVLVDTNGLAHDVDLLHPLDGARPGADVAAVEAGLGIRWTFGFEIPTNAREGRFELRRDTVPVAAWPLTTDPTTTAPVVPEISTIRLGDEIPWDDGVRIRPTGIGSLMCGDPTIEPVAHIVTLAVDVTTSTAADYVWPGLRYPDVPAIAQWKDGSAAATVTESAVGGDDPYYRYLGASGVLLPPGTAARRAFVMAAPRDGRFVDVSRLPSGIWLDPPAGDPMWLDLGGVRPTIGVDPSFCDLGGVGAPLPYAFGPGPAFTAPAASDADLVARSLLRSAVAAAVITYDRGNLTFIGKTTADFAAVAPELEWVETGTDTPPSTSIGVISYAVVDTNTFYTITESGSGRWFCTKLSIGGRPIHGEGSTGAEAAGVCLEKAVGVNDGA